MKLTQASVRIACLAVLGWTATALATAPNALKSAYWRFEEGPRTAEGRVAGGTSTVIDSSPDLQHGICHTTEDLQRAPSLINHHPFYSTEVPTNRLLRSDLPNTASLKFDWWWSVWVGGWSGMDFWTDKNINNPVFTDITIEAAFKPDAIAPEGRFLGIIAKTGQPTALPEPPLVLKIRGDDGTLQIEVIDKSGQLRSVRSLEPLVAGQWYFAAVVGTADTLKLYLDRGDDQGYVLQGTTPVTGGAPMIQHNLNDPADTISPITGGMDEWKMNTSWVVGRGCYANQNVDWFDGLIDEVRISTSALPPEQFLWKPAPPPNPADFDGSGAVDSIDQGILEACNTGPEIDYNPQALPAECDSAGMQPDGEGKIKPDIDKDGDVDQSDYGLWQTWYTGG